MEWQRDKNIAECHEEVQHHNFTRWDQKVPVCVLWQHELGHGGLQLQRTGYACTPNRLQKE